MPIAAQRHLARAGAAVAVAFTAWRAYVGLRDRPRTPRRCLSSSLTTVRTVRMHARSSPGAAPDATPVVLVHGLGVSGTYLVPLAERLPLAHAVHVPDLPGHGASDTPAQPLDVEQLGESLVEWMDARGIVRAVLLGQSMGAQVALAVAARHSSRVARLVLVGPSVDDRARSLARQALRLLADVPVERPSLVPIVLRDWLRRRARIIPELRAMLRDEPEARASRVRCPTLMVRGALDPVAPRAWVHRLAAHIGDAPVVVIPDWGHGAHHAAPDVLVAALEPFLRPEAGSGRPLPPADRGDDASRMIATSTAGHLAAGHAATPTGP